MDDTPPTISAYTSAARRLRARHASRPRELLRALRALADRHDAGNFDTPQQEADELQVADLPPAVGFAHVVADQLRETPMLTWSQRSALLRQAGRMGVERFEANLVIAVQQHRMTPDRQELFTEPVPDATARSRRGIVIGLSLVLIAEIAAVAGAWAMWMR